MNLRKFSFSILLVILIVFGVIFQSVAMFKSAKLFSIGGIDEGIGYWGPLARDGIWHEALVGALQNSYRPQNPALAGEPLVRYHYYYDLVVAVLTQLTGISAREYIYRIMPVLMSTLLGLGSYLLAISVFKNKFAALISTYLVYFGSSFGWIIDLLHSREIGGESAFWANQPVSFNLNPPFAISLVIFIFSLLLLSHFLGQQVKTKRTAKDYAVIMIFVLLAGSLIGFKSYAGIIFLGGLFALTIKKVVVDKRYFLIPIFLAVSVISLIIFLPNLGSAPLITYSPLWLVNSMIDLTDRVGWIKLSSARSTFASQPSYFKLLIVEAVSLFIFIFGNIGTRFVFLAGLKDNFHKIYKNDLTLFLFAASLVSVVIPLVFVQNGNPWNIVQFFYYFLYFAAIYAGYGLWKIYKNLPKKLAGTALIAFLLVTPISSAATFNSWLYPTPPAYLPLGELEALEFLSAQPDGVVLKHPYQADLRQKYQAPYPLFAYADNAYVSAYSTMQVYLEDEEQQIILATDYEERVRLANRFFVEKDTTWSNTFLKESSIKYIYMPRVYYLPMAEQLYNLDLIFENEGVKVYKVN